MSTFARIVRGIRAGVTCGLAGAGCIAAAVGSVFVFGTEHPDGGVHITGGVVLLLVLIALAGVLLMIAAVPVMGVGLWRALRPPAADPPVPALPPPAYIPPPATPTGPPSLTELPPPTLPAPPPSAGALASIFGPTQPDEVRPVSWLPGATLETYRPPEIKGAMRILNWIMAAFFFLFFAFGLWNALIGPMFGPVLFLSGTQVTAEVVSVTNTDSCTATVAYRAGAEQLVTASQRPDGSYCGLQAGDTIDIVYRDDDPSQWRPAGISTPFLITGGVYLVLALFFLGLASGKLGKRRPRQIIRLGGTRR